MPLSRGKSVYMIPSDPKNPDRRDFLKKACAGGLGAAIVLVPVGAGLTVLFDPLGRKAQAIGSVQVTKLDALPADGVPRKFSIVASQVDAWNRANNVPIGAVYLRRTGENSVEALNVICPHAGCFVDYRSSENDFYCPCHNSSFHLGGAIASETSPSPRGMDSLEVEVREGNEVWVKFMNFQTGRPDTVPVA